MATIGGGIMTKPTVFLIGIVIALLVALFMGGCAFGLLKLGQIETITIKQLAFGIGLYWFMETITDFSREVL